MSRVDRIAPKRQPDNNKLKTKLYFVGNQSQSLQTATTNKKEKQRGDTQRVLVSTTSYLDSQLLSFARSLAVSLACASVSAA